MSECIICYDEPSESWVCDRCAHTVCLTCFHRLLTEDIVKCPYCRLIVEESKSIQHLLPPIDIPLWVEDIMQEIDVGISAVQLAYLRTYSVDSFLIDRFIVDLLEND